jgi:hypothetical protein
LRLADSSSKESHHLCKKKDYENEDEARAPKRAVEPLMKGKKIMETELVAYELYLMGMRSCTYSLIIIYR